jgi:hypothetical protein
VSISRQKASHITSKKSQHDTQTQFRKLKKKSLPQVRESKKRKLNHLKKIQKEEREDYVSLQKQSSWKMFNKKNSGRGGFMKSGMGKESIFASRDDAKIGVMGGGTGGGILPGQMNRGVGSGFAGATGSAKSSLPKR